MHIPPWFHRLPTSSRGRHVVIVDNNVLSSYLFEATPSDTVRFLFEHDGVTIQCGRQVIDEALNHPGLDVALRQRAWQRLGELQDAGRLVLSGNTQMTPSMFTIYSELARLLAAANLSAADARVFADSIVKRVPVFTQDGRAKTALINALRNAEVRNYLSAHSLPTTADEIVIS